MKSFFVCNPEILEVRQNRINFGPMKNTECFTEFAKSTLIILQDIMTTLKSSYKEYQVKARGYIYKKHQSSLTDRLGQINLRHPAVSVCQHPALDQHGQRPLLPQEGGSNL